MEKKLNSSKNIKDSEELSKFLNNSELSSSKLDLEKPANMNKNKKKTSEALKKAELSRDEHNWKEALKNYNEAISIAPGDPNIYYGRGFTYLLIAYINKYKKSIEDNEIDNYLKKAADDINKEIKNSGNHYTYYFILGLTYKLFGKLESANRNFEKAKELNKEIDIKKSILKFDKMIKEESKLITPNNIEIEEDSIDQAEKLLNDKISNNFRIISKEILSDGKPKIISSISDDLETAIKDLKSKIPEKSIIIETHDPIEPSDHIEIIKEMDEELALLNAKSNLPLGATILKYKLIHKGKKGFLGIGRKPNTYEFKIQQKAVCKYTIKEKAKIIAKLGQVPKWAHNDPKIRISSIENLLLTGQFIILQRLLENDPSDDVIKAVAKSISKDGVLLARLAENYKKNYDDLSYNTLLKLTRFNPLLLKEISKYIISNIIILTNADIVIENKQFGLRQKGKLFCYNSFLQTQLNKLESIPNDAIPELRQLITNLTNISSNAGSWSVDLVKFNKDEQQFFLSDSKPISTMRFELKAIKDQILSVVEKIKTKEAFDLLAEHRE